MKFKEIRILLVLLIFTLIAFACRERADSPLVGPLPIHTITTAKDEAVMVYVPAGEFLMGTSDADIEYYKEIFPLRRITRFDNERPQRTVFVDAFYIDKYEVTNKQYKQFLAETGYTPKHYLDYEPYNTPNFPAVVLEWEDAVAYTNWAGKDCQRKRNGRRRLAAQMDVSGPGEMNGMEQNSAAMTVPDSRMDIKRPHLSDSFHKVQALTGHTIWRVTSGSGCRTGMIQTIIGPHPPISIPRALTPAMGMC